MTICVSKSVGAISLSLVSSQNLVSDNRNIEIYHFSSSDTRAIQHNMIRYDTVSGPAPLVVRA